MAGWLLKQAYAELQKGEIRDEVELHVLGCQLTYQGQIATSADRSKHGSMLLYVHGNRKAR